MPSLSSLYNFILLFSTYPWMPQACVVTSTRSSSWDALTTLWLMLGATATPIKRRIIETTKPFFKLLIFFPFLFI